LSSLAKRSKIFALSSALMLMAGMAAAAAARAGARAARGAAGGEGEVSSRRARAQ
jgi:hypothetical protein